MPTKVNETLSVEKTKIESETQKRFNDNATLDSIYAFLTFLNTGVHYKTFNKPSYEQYKQENEREGKSLTRKMHIEPTADRISSQIAPESNSPQIASFQSAIRNPKSAMP